jgi:hypothetical protein
MCQWPETGPMTEHSCHVIITSWMQTKYMNPFHVPHAGMQTKYQYSFCTKYTMLGVTHASVILDTSVATCFKTSNYSLHHGQTHVYSMYVYHNKRLKTNLQTSSVSISGLNCLELQALLLCLLVLAPRYGCFLQSRLQTGSGRAAEYHRLASTCSKTKRPSKKQHKLSNVNDKNATKLQISMLTQESCSW